MKKIIITTLILFIFCKINAQEKQNYVSPTDSNLSILKIYDNPNRAAWNIGATAGVDVSSFNGAVFYELSGSFCPKKFNFRASFALPLVGEFITSSELYKKSNSYSNLMLAGVFNFKDKTEDLDHKPTVGINVLSRTSTTIKYNAFYTDGQKIKKRTTKGLGITFNTIASNMFYDSAKVNYNKSQTVTLENNQALPNGFLLKYTNTFFGLGWHSSTMESYKYIYQYTYEGKKLGKHKIRQTSFKHVGIELLIAPGMAYEKQIIYENANVILNANIKDVKARLWGFRLVANTNQLFKGKKMFKTYTKPGFYQNGEMGMRPGIYYNKISKDGTKAWANSILSQPFYMKYSIGITF